MAWKLVPPTCAAVVILAGCGQVGTTSAGPQEELGGAGGEGVGAGGSEPSAGGAGQGGAGVGGDAGEGGGSVPDGCSPTGQQCAADEYCDYGSDNCGDASALGRCRPQPSVCPDDPAPTCGCDGTIYYNGCVANQEGVDAANTGGCAAPAGYFTCGATFCQSHLDYCQRSPSDVVNTPDEYSCKALPSACNAGAATCACLAGELCGTACERVDGSDDLIVTCPGG